MNNNRSLVISLEVSLKGQIPQQVSCFTWLVIRRARLTHEVSQRRGLHLMLKVFSRWPRSRDQWLFVIALQHNCKFVEFVLVYTRCELGSAQEYL